MDYDLNRALKKINDDPTSLGPYHEFIPVAIETLQLDAAMQAAEAALEIDSLNHDSWLLAARVLEERGDFTGAIKIYEQLIRQDPDKAQYRYHLGLDQFSVGEFSAGLNNFKWLVLRLCVGLTISQNYGPGEKVFFLEEQKLVIRLCSQFLPHRREIFRSYRANYQRLIPLIQQFSGYYFAIEK